MLLRLVQGIAVGGEWSGSVLLSMEWGDQKRRGFWASMPQLGVAFGLILGTGFLYLVSAVLTDAQFTSWGWRIPFLFSIVLVAIGLWIRLQILETPMFAKRLKEKNIAKLPSIEVLRVHWKPILLSAFARMSEQAPFYVITAFTLTYLTETEGYSKTFALSAILSAAGVELVAVPLFGHLSDTVGRKKVYLTGAALTGVYGFVLFAALGSGVAIVAFVAMLIALIPHAMQYGPQASLIAEAFPTSLRYAGAGLGYQLASVVAGGPAPLVATYLLKNTGSVYSIAWAILGCAVITIIAVVLMPDHSKSDINDDATYAKQRGSDGRRPARRRVRRIIGLAGAPGVGKTTYAVALAAREHGVHVPMDGFHLADVEPAPARAAATARGRPRRSTPGGTPPCSAACGPSRRGGLRARLRA